MCRTSYTFRSECNLWPTWMTQRPVGHENELIRAWPQSVDCLQGGVQYLHRARLSTVGSIERIELLSMRTLLISSSFHG